MGDALRWGWLGFKLQRSEIVFVAALCLGLAGAALWLTVDMRSALARCGSPAAPEACGVVYAFQSTHGHAVQTIQIAMGFAMYAMPLVLGVQVITREIEQKTAMIAWPLAGSRLKWLAWRVLPVFVIGMVLIGVMAFAAEQLARAYLPHSDIGFQNHGMRGISMVTRAGLVLIAAVALGAVIGRLLPALLVGIALAYGVSAAMEAALPMWAEPARLPQNESVFAGAFPLTTGLEFRFPDGRPMSDEEYETYLTTLYEEHGPEPDQSLMPQEVFYGVAPSRYNDVVARESAALVGATGVAAALTAIVVRRRRPE